MRAPQEGGPSTVERQRVSTPPDLERVYTTRNAWVCIAVPGVGLHLPDLMGRIIPPRERQVAHALSCHFTINPQPESPRPEGAQDCRALVSNAHIFMTRGAESPEVLALGGSSGALIPRPQQVAGVAPPLGPWAPPLPPPEVGAAGRTGRAGAERLWRAWRGGAERLLSAGAVVGPRVGEGVVAGPAGWQRAWDGSGQCFKSFFE